MKFRLAASALAVATLIAACGGASTPGPSASANTCFPVKGQCPEEAQTLTASGATFPAVIYTKWVDEYYKSTGVQVNYQAIGSGGGIKAITEKTVDFAGSDAPMTDAQLAAVSTSILHIPTVMGAVVPTFNIPGVTKLNLTPDTLAGIYLGTIKTWNDPKLATDNPGVTFPSANITPVFRSDSSGTTFAFTDYLAKVSPDFKSKVGAGTAVTFPSGVGGKGNDGVAGVVKSTPNSIGYVELIYALQNKIAYGSVQNMSGEFVRASVDAVTAAAAVAAKQMPPDFRVSITNAPGPGVYPVSSFTWLLFYENPKDKKKAKIMVDFVRWALGDGQKYCRDLGYAPLPEGVVALETEALKRIKL